LQRPVELAQYTALRFTQRLADAGVAPSTGRVGDSYDNALAQNLWSSIKIELLYWAGTQFASRAEAEATLLRYIDGWYNPRRIQQRLGGLAPEEYEEAWHRHNHSKGFVTVSGNETSAGVGHDPV
jgi:putative transposase